MRLCLIGKKEDWTRGFIPLTSPPNTIDMRDKTDLGEMMALISMAPILISNDSSPIHIAGAFNNHIIVIPTCKDPGLILPYRNGKAGWNSRSMYKKKMSDDFILGTPTIIGEKLADKVPSGGWDAYLPEVQDVVYHVMETVGVSTFV
jgi:ADP-heptose:LPS heptosyltransferase